VPKCGKNLGFALVLGVSLFAQAPATPKYGSLTKIDAAGLTLEVKTDAGDPLAVTLDPKASFRRIPFGETDLRKAETIALTDVAVGDRVMVRGKISDDQKSMAATLVLVMAKAEVAKKQAADQADEFPGSEAEQHCDCSPKSKTSDDKPSRDGNAD